MFDWQTVISTVGAAVPFAAIAKFRFESHMSALKEEGSVRQIKNELESSFFLHQAYLSWLETFLTSLDKIFGPSRFSAFSYGVCLRFSLAYILGSVMLIWFLSGQDTSGISNAFPANQPAYVRLLAVICCGLATYCLIAAMRLGGLFAVGLAVVAILLSFLGSYFVGSEDFAVLSAVTSAVIVSAIAAVVPTEASGYPATAKIFSVAGICALVIAIPLYLAGNHYFFVWAASIAMAALQSALVSYTWTWFELRSKAHIFHIVFWITIVSLMYLVFLPEGQKIIPREGLLLAVFWGLLPLLNAPFDWTTLAVTRKWLRKTIKAQGDGAIRNAAIDVVISFALLLCLSMFVTAALCLINLLSTSFGLGRPLKIAELFHSLRTDGISWSIAWVYVMILSTFVPTFGHLVTASLAISTWALRKRIGQKLGFIISGDLNSNYYTRFSAAALLSVRDLVSILLPIGCLILVVSILVGGFPWVGRSILWASENVAHLFGESVLPGQVF